MRILYGVAGEGYGHSSRARQVIPFLQSRGHEVLVFSYGQGYDVLSKEFRCVNIAGIHFAFDEGKLSVSGTAKNVLAALGKNVLDWKRIKKEVDGFGPDVCISDMEPFVPIIRRLYGLPLICFDNQHRLTHLKFSVPREYRTDFVLARESVKRIVSRADAFVFVSFAKLPLKMEGAFQVDPLLRDAVLSAPRREGDYVLVYQTKQDRSLLEKLAELDEKFVVYGYNEDRKDGKFEFRAAGPRYIEDLAGAKAVVASAGFMSISEAIYLKKPYFAVPLRGQFEQTFNGILLRDAGFGEFSEEPSLSELREFLGNLGKYRSVLEKHKMNPREALEVLDGVLSKI